MLPRKTLTVFFLLAGCLLEPLMAQFPRPSLYFPLSDGNEWTYTRREDDSKRTVTFDVAIDVPSFIAGNMKNTFWGDLAVSKLKQDFGPQFLKDSIFAISEEDRSVRGLLLNPRPGTTFLSAFGENCGGPQMKVELIGRKTVPAGTFRDCIRVLLDCPFLADYGMSYTLAPGIGIIEFCEYSGEGFYSRVEQLSSATVNGEEFGFEDPDVELRLQLSKRAFGTDDRIRARLTVVNNSSEPIFYEPDCLDANFSFRDAIGRIVFSEESLIDCGDFDPIVLELASGEEMHTTFGTGHSLVPGTYRLHADSWIFPGYSASAPFTIE